MTTVRCISPSLVGVGTFGVEVVADVAVVVNGGVGEGSDVDAVVVISVSTSSGVFGAGITTSGSRTVTLSQTSTPAASKTSKIGA